jgi:SAM-dependent methyltransferase
MMHSSNFPTPGLTLTDDYKKIHQRRFDLSLEWLKPYFGDTNVLELGGVSPFTPMLDGKCYHAAFDEDHRRPLELDSGFWDVVLLMEVLEHIGDTDGLHTEWQGDGAAKLLSETFRVLKPGGMLFLTTPNAASITAIHHAMRLAPPMIFRPHVREYAPYELDHMVRAAGFTITRRETFDVWRNAISDRDHQALEGAIYNLGYPVELRGEDIFVLAQKPF